MQMKNTIPQPSDFPPFWERYHSSPGGNGFLKNTAVCQLVQSPFPTWPWVLGSSHTPLVWPASQHNASKCSFMWIAKISKITAFTEREEKKSFIGIRRGKKKKLNQKKLPLLPPPCYNSLKSLSKKSWKFQMIPWLLDLCLSLKQKKHQDFVEKITTEGNTDHCNYTEKLWETDDIYVIENSYTWVFSSWVLNISLHSLLEKINPVQHAEGWKETYKPSKM